MIVTGHTFMKLISLLREYKDGGYDYQEFLQEKQNSTNDSEIVSNEEIELFVEIIKFEDFLVEVLEAFYKVGKIRIRDDICIYLVILYVVCFQISKMMECTIEELASKYYPMKWHKILKFICRRKYHMLITNIGTKYLDVDFCNSNIWEPLQSKSEWMKDLLKKLNNSWIKGEKSLAKTVKDTNLKFDKTDQSEQKAYTIGMHKGMDFKEEIDEYTYWTSLPKTFEIGQEDSLCFKQGIKAITERMNPLSNQRETLVQQNNDSQLTRTDSPESLNTNKGKKMTGNTDDRKVDSRQEDKMLSNDEITRRGDNVLSQKTHSKNLKNERIQRRKEITGKSRMQENVTYLPSNLNSVLNCRETEVNSVLQLKNQNFLPISLNSMQKKFPVLSNTTTLLREAAVLQKNEQEQIRMLQDVSKGGRDPLLWRKLEDELREKEKMERREAMEVKHLQALLWQEEAILAKRNVWQMNQLEASKLKKELQERLHLKKLHAQQEIEERQRLAKRQQQQKQEYLEDVYKFLTVHKQIRKKLSLSNNKSQETKHPESNEIIELKKLLEEKRAQKIFGNKI